MQRGTGGPTQHFTPHQRDRRATKIDLVLRCRSSHTLVTALCERVAARARLVPGRRGNIYLQDALLLLANKASRCVPTRLGTTSVSRRRIPSQQSVLEAECGARSLLYIYLGAARAANRQLPADAVRARAFCAPTQKSFCTFAERPRERDSTTSFIAGHLHQRGDAHLLIKLAAVSCPHQVIDIRNTQRFFPTYKINQVLRLLFAPLNFCDGALPFFGGGLLEEHPSAARINK
jgi:hypothetical protein